LIAIAARREELARQLEAAGQAPPLLHPSMADLYRQKVTSLAQALEHPDSRPEAAETLRGLIDEIVLTPVVGTLHIELKGNLAAMLGAAQSLETDEISQQSGSVGGGSQATRRRPFDWLRVVPSTVEGRGRRGCRQGGVQILAPQPQRHERGDGLAVTPANSVGCGGRI